MNAETIQVINSLTPQEAGIVKAAAAQKFAEQRVRPATAEYVFARYIQKHAAPRPTVTPRAVKLASQLEPIVAAARQATA